MASGVEIIYLPGDSALVRTVAEWHQLEWSHFSGRTVEDRIAEFAEHRDTSALPLTVIAVEGGRPVGSASLLERDMEEVRMVTPWLGSVFVLPEHRGGGIGSLLCRRIADEARRLGVETLYLFTPDKSGLYERMGWNIMEKLSYHGTEVTLMSLGL